MEKIINYTLTASGVSPDLPQWGGIQGEHRATALVFTPDGEVSEAIAKAQSDGATAVFKIDAVTAAGEQFWGQEREVSLISDPYYLTSEMTCSGLDTVIVLRLILKGEDGQKRELYKAQVQLYFTASPLLPEGVSADKKQKTDELEEKAEELLRLFEEKAARADELLTFKVELAFEKAAASANQLKRVNELAEQTEKVSLTLQQGTEFVFVGGDATASAEMLFTVDEELSEESINPVQNKAITAQINKINSSVQTANQEIQSLGSSLDLAKEELSARDEQLQLEADALAEKIALLTEETSALQEETKSISESVTDLQGEAEAINGNVSALQSEVDAMKEGALLWEGTMFMDAGQTAPLSQKVSEQTHGIVIAFCGYDSGATQSDFFYFFVPKTGISLNSGRGCNFNLCGAFKNGIKYLYIYDDKISGNDINTNTSLTVGGITYSNKQYILRYVFGV